MEKVFGIDLGTTYSCVAYVNENEKAETIKNAEGTLTTPSVIYFDSVERQIVGDEAKSYAVTEPEKSVSFIKREMGKDYRRTIFDIKYSPQELSATILKKLMLDANNTLKEQGVISEGEEIKKAVITCPAYFGMSEKNATKEAGEIAGIEVLDIINEPTAAAINYGVTKGEETKRVLVYDLGGGTFDVTIIDIAKGKVKVVCTGGDAELGGKDWDEATVRYLLEKWQDENNSSEDITMNLETKSAMLMAAEKAKKTLTLKEEAKVNFVHDGETFRTVITRADFDEYTSTLLNKTIQMTNECIGKMNQDRKIDEIILVGGSSRMPQVKARIETEFKLPVHLFDPDEAVAKGAAIYALEKATSNGGAHAPIGSGGGHGIIDIIDVSSRTYGTNAFDVRLNHNVIVNFIFQNQELPAVKEQTFAMLDDADSTRFDIYESIAQENITDLKEVERYEPVCGFDLIFKERVPKDTKIYVKMTLDNNGLLSVYAEEMLNHSQADFKIEVKNGLSDEEKRAANLRSGVAKVE